MWMDQDWQVDIDTRFHLKYEGKGTLTNIYVRVPLLFKGKILIINSHLLPHRTENARPLFYLICSHFTRKTILHIRTRLNNANPR